MIPVVLPVTAVEEGEQAVMPDLTLDGIAAALEKTLANHLGGEHGYYSPDRVGDGWLDTQIENMAAALFDDGWTPPVVLPVALERGQR